MNFLTGKDRGERVGKWNVYELTDINNFLSKTADTVNEESYEKTDCS